MMDHRATPYIVEMAEGDKKNGRRPWPAGLRKVRNRLGQAKERSAHVACHNATPVDADGHALADRHR